MYLKQLVGSSEDDEQSETYDSEGLSDVSRRSDLRSAIDQAKEDIFESIDYFSVKYVATAKRDAHNTLESLYRDLQKKYKRKN